MIRRLIYFSAPLASLIFATLGNGLFTTVISLRLQIQGASSFLVGLMMGFYYAGMVIGAFRSEAFILRVGHIRAYASIASTLAILSLLQGLMDEIWISLILRFATGWCIAGIYIIVESWLLANTPITARGRILAFYMIALYGAQASGQFLLNWGSPNSLLPFSLIALLSSLAVIPVAVTYVRAPKIEQPSRLPLITLFKLTPHGTFSCFCSGLILGAIYGLMPFYVKSLNYSNSDVAIVMSLLIYGGMALQYPIGYFSDYIGRRRILIAVSLLTAILAVLFLLFAQKNKLIFFSLAFFFGGFSFSAYPVSVSLACDIIEKRNIIAATQALLLAYGIGATLGPVAAPIFIHHLNVLGLPIYFIVIAALLAFFSTWAKYKKIFTHLVKLRFIALPRSTPIASQLDPRAETSTSHQQNKER